MGALIGIAVQLTMLAIRLAIMLVVLMVRLSIMLVAAVVGAVSSRRR
jgi:hypothetical protein